MIRRLSAAAAVVSLMALAACASPSRPEAMILGATPGLIASSGDLGYRSVTSVIVSGGSETNPLWTAQVSNEDLKIALQGSQAAAGYMGSDGRPMVVTANMVELAQPMMGLDMSVTSRIQYSVQRRTRGLQRHRLRHRHRHDGRGLRGRRTSASGEREVDPGKHQTVHHPLPRHRALIGRTTL